MKQYVLNVFKNILRDAVKNPQEASFIVKFGIGLKISKRRRENCKRKGKMVPKVLVGSLNSNCNYFCRGCYKRNNKKIIEEKENVLSSRKWKEILIRAKDSGVISFAFAGGEPLKRKDVLYEAAKIKSIVFPVFISVNTIGDEDIKMFNENRNIIPVLRLKGEEEKEAEYFIKTVKSLYRYDIYYGVSVNINKENLTKASEHEFIESIYNYGCKALIFTEDLKRKVIDDNDREFLKKREKALRKNYDNILFFYINEKDKKGCKCLGFDEDVLQINSKGCMNRCLYLK